MGTYREVYGDLIALALDGEFDVITHGCNSHCVMSAGIAVPMARTFRCNEYPMEGKEYRGDINKLGMIESVSHEVKDGKLTGNYDYDGKAGNGMLAVVNSYTQYGYGINYKDGTVRQLDYEALTLCMRKINYKFKGLRVGVPLIGGGLAGGDPDVIREILKNEFKDCDLTLVLFNK
jgi:O-acetyl-ADP-ribose deacetylase (regulator of RNase III)